MAVFWFITPCSLVEVYRHFRDTCFLIIRDIMKTASTLGKSVKVFQTSRRKNPKSQRIVKNYQRGDLPELLPETAY